MVSLSLALSRSQSASSSLNGKDRLSYESEEFVHLDRPTSATSRSLKSSTSSTLSLTREDIEDVTITVRKSDSVDNSTPTGRSSSENLRSLAISTHMTELSYSMSDIQTRIFEIQELRHQSQSSEDASSSSSTTVIDQALMSLDERLEAVNRGMKSVNEAMQPFLRQATSERVNSESDDESDDIPALLRKHAALVADWDSVQDESEVLREELKEDKWLTVFRTVSEQADGMMSSLEKAVQRCQDFIWRAHRRAVAAEESPRSSFSGSPSNSDRKKAPLTYETFLALQESFEAKKKHYMPATSKVLSIIDKGVQDRVTKNGECLRRHAESTARWKNLRDRISRTDLEMVKVRRLYLSNSDANDETESVISSKSSGPLGSSTGHGFATPYSEGSRGRTVNAMGTLSRSISPLRKFAKKITKVGRGTPTQSPSPAPSQKSHPKTPATDPLPTLKKRQSLFPLRNPISAMTAMTPERFTHKHSHSFTPESPTMSRKQSETSSIASSAVKSKGPKWNSSTKIENEGTKTIKLTKKSSMSTMRNSSINGDAPPVPPLPPGHARPSSRSSFASSRPWSPITASQGSTTRSSISRPPSRASPSASGSRVNGRARPSAGAAVPTPPYWRSVSSSSDISFDDVSAQSSLMQRLSPTPSTMTDYPPRSKTPLGTPLPHPRPPSRSMIPIPKLAFSAASRPSTAMSDYEDNPPRPGSSMSFRSSATRAQTPESALRSRVAQLPYYSTTNDPVQSPNATLRRASSRLPPSSFRESSAPHLPSTPSNSQPRSVSSSSRPPSRSSSRAGRPSLADGFDSAQTQRKYVPQNMNDPLDVEIAAIVNAFPHGLLVERVDPYLSPRAPPPGENEEVKAQYAFTNQVARKVITCRLLTMGRATAKSRKKVMCRVGGGWQDLHLYILNRQAGM